MQDVMAQLIEQIGAGGASVDGKYLLLKVMTNGQERIFAFQQSQLLGLIDIVCGVRTENERINPSGPSGVFGAEGFELAETTEGNVVFEAEFGAGGRLGFQFDRTGAERLLDLLQALLSGVTPGEPRRRLN
jgi:hypothetical protein